MKKGDHAIKAVRRTLRSLYPQGHLDFNMEEGEIYHSEDGYSVCDSIPATFKYYPYPVLNAYLEVELLSDVEKIEEHSYRTKDIKVIREIPLAELKNDPAVVKYFKEWDKPDKKEELMMFMEKEKSEILARGDKRDKRLWLIALIPLILSILYLVIPILLVYFGYSK